MFFFESEFEAEQPFAFHSVVKYIQYNIYYIYSLQMQELANTDYKVRPRR